MLIELMRNDIGAAIEVWKNDPDNQTWIRIVVRLSFTALDSYCWIAKKLFYYYLKGRAITPSSKDLKFITGIYEKNGTYYRYRSTPTENISYIAGRLAKLSANSWDIGDQSTQWQDFHDSVKIRHRITHPRCTSDLIISDAEAEKVGQSVCWIQIGLNRLIEGIGHRKSKPTTGA